MAELPEKAAFGVGIHWAERADEYGVTDVIVSKVHLDGPADRSGKVKDGDVLIAVDGESVIGKGLIFLSEKIPGALNTIVKLTFNRGIGGTYTVDLVRSSASVTPRSSLNDSFQQPPQYVPGLATVGFSIDPTPPYRIADITDGSSAQAREFKVGDLLVTIDNRPVQGLNEGQIQAALAGPVSSIVVIKTANMTIPVPVARDCALEIDAAELAAWKLPSDEVSEDVRGKGSQRARERAAPPPPPTEYAPENQPRADKTFMAPTVEMVLRLDVDFDTIADIPLFAEEVRSDVASAANLDRSKVSVLNMKAGSTIVNLSIEGDETRTALHIATGLKLQVSNPASRLRTGKHTSRVVDLTLPSEKPRLGSSSVPPANNRPNVQGYIDNQGIFRQRNSSNPALEKQPMFTTNQIPQPGPFNPQKMGPWGPSPNQQQQQPFANYNAVAGPRSNGGSVGAQPGPGPFTMVNVGLNPQGMHPSIMMALKQQFSNKDAAGAQNPFGNYYAAFRGGSVGGSNASYGGSNASYGGGGSAGGSNAGDFGPRLHTSLTMMPPFQQMPWGVSSSAPAVQRMPVNMMPVYRPQYQNMPFPVQFQQRPTPVQYRVMQMPMMRQPPNFQFQPQMMRQPVMMQMQPARMMTMQAPMMQMQPAMMPMQATGAGFWGY